MKTALGAANICTPSSEFCIFAGDHILVPIARLLLQCKKLFSDLSSCVRGAISSAGVSEPVPCQPTLQLFHNWIFGHHNKNCKVKVETTENIFQSITTFFWRCVPKV